MGQVTNEGVKFVCRWFTNLVVLSAFLDLQLERKNSLEPASWGLTFRGILVGWKQRTLIKTKLPQKHCLFGDINNCSYHELSSIHKLGMYCTGIFNIARWQFFGSYKDCSPVDNFYATVLICIRSKIDWMVISCSAHKYFSCQNLMLGSLDCCFNLHIFF